MRSSHLAALVVATALAAPLAGGVRLSEGPLVLPTYELDAPNPNPSFPGQSRRRPTYPYPLLDGLTTRRVPKTYRAVFLENEYLKVTVLPELGGKLYSIYDKGAGREVLYTNHVVKYGLVAIRGAWTSGGIEWNFPDGHTVTTVSPVDYVTRTEADGSAAVTVGDTERIQRMQWSVTIRLRPGWKLVETEVWLNNRRDVPGRYWYWATAAAPAKDDLRFVYPMREAYPHAWWPVYSFPIHNGVDVGTYREVKNALSLFARQSLRDFMAVYYEKSDQGVVHVADHRIVQGKKTWTWGTSDAGRIWIGKLTDNDGQYVEFQAGRFETQMEHEYIAPNHAEHFTHYWYPVDRLGGGLVEATRFAALNLKVDGSKGRLWVSANTPVQGARLSIEQGLSELVWGVDLVPGKPYSTEFDLTPIRKPIHVLLTAADGRELLRYSTDTPVDGNPDFHPATKPPDEPTTPTAEQAYVRGVSADKKSDEIGARREWEAALKLDPASGPARAALGLSYYRTGEYDTAASYLDPPPAADARYTLALVRRAQGRLDEAERLLRACDAPAARHVLGEMALARGDARSAIAELSGGDAPKTRTLLAVAYRLAGRAEEARKVLDGVLADVPADYLALNEAGRTGDLARLFAREPDSALELAFDYAAAGRLEDAAAALDRALEGSGADDRFPSSATNSSDSRQATKNDGLPHRPYAMAHYVRGYLAEKLGDKARAAKEYALGAAADSAYVFPHRKEEIEVLRAAVAVNPNDGRAQYYLGNALASKYRTREAIAAWREAVRLDPRNAVAWRNLGAFLPREEAVRAYRRAVAAAPGDWRLYLELDSALGGDRAARVALLEGAPPTVRQQPQVSLALARAYFHAGRLEAAARHLDAGTFVTSEGDAGPLGLFQQVHRALGRELSESGRHQQAAAEYLRAAEHPRNLGVGSTSAAAPPREFVLAARELDKAGRRDEAAKLWTQAAGSAIEDDKLSEEHYYKALALEHVGKKAEARALLSRIEAENPEWLKTEAK